MKPHRTNRGDIEAKERQTAVSPQSNQAIVR